MDRINTLARALVFACTPYDDDGDSLSALASDNPLHDNQWQNQKLSRDTTRMLHTFCTLYAKLWGSSPFVSGGIDWHEVGMVLAATGCGYDDKGQESLQEVCQGICRTIWPEYEHSAMWRLTKQRSLALECPKPTSLLLA